MAIVSSHVLDGTDGTHAANVEIQLSRIDSNGSRRKVFHSQTDGGGRLLETLDSNLLVAGSTYELQLETGNYWQNKWLKLQREQPLQGQQSPDNANINCDQIIFRFRMPEDQARYHVPFIISPNNYSVWWSAPETT